MPAYMILGLPGPAELLILLAVLGIPAVAVLILLRITRNDDGEDGS